MLESNLDRWRMVLTLAFVSCTRLVQPVQLLCRGREVESLYSFLGRGFLEGFFHR